MCCIKLEKQPKICSTSYLPGPHLITTTQSSPLISPVPYILAAVLLSVHAGSDDGHTHALTVRCRHQQAALTVPPLEVVVAVRAAQVTVAAHQTHAAPRLPQTTALCGGIVSSVSRRVKIAFFGSGS